MAYTHHDLGDTIVALATPQGVGAIGVIRLSGKEAINICNAVFPSKDLTKQDTHTIHYGTIRDDKNRIVDEVLVSLFVAPKSYTKENIVEVSCHGSPYIHQQIIQLFLQKGARLAKPGEFTMRAFLNGQMDLSQAEAVADLIAASSESAHTIALQQMRGGFSNEIQKLRQELIDFASLIELELDFGEEDVEFADRAKLQALVEKIQGLLRSLIQSFQLGNVIKNGVTTVIAGRPNAGKSTLLNALLNEDRAIVSEIAGTTRDTIEEILNIKGIAFRLIDTAGIRDATDTIETMGIEKTMAKIKQSAILVYLFPILELMPPDVLKDIEKLYKEGMKVIVVANKMDELESMHDNPQHHFNNNYTEKGYNKILNDLNQRDGYEILYISAKSGQNVEDLKTALYRMVLEKEITQDTSIVSNARHYEALEKSYASLADVLTGMDMEVTGDFLAMDIRRALAFLGEITGEISTDDLLGNIFGKFCIGK